MINSRNLIYTNILDLTLNDKLLANLNDNFKLANDTLDRLFNIQNDLNSIYDSF